VATVRAVQRRIEVVEGFRVTIRHLDGRNVRDDRMRMPMYPLRRAVPDRWNVAQWKEARFLPTYPGFDVDVLGADDRRVHGGTLLGSLRREYAAI
jgi:hypothetical protein